MLNERGDNVCVGNRFIYFVAGFDVIPIDQRIPIRKINFYSITRFSDNIDIHRLIFSRLNIIYDIRCHPYGDGDSMHYFA